MKKCRNCRYIRKTKEMWCKCTGYSVKPNDTCDKWENSMKKCDICGRAIYYAGLLIGKDKNSGKMICVCDECGNKIVNKMEQALLKGVRQNNDLDND